MIRSSVRFRQAAQRKWPLTCGNAGSGAVLVSLREAGFRGNSGDTTGHQTIEAEYELHGGIDRLAAELETIAADAQHDRFTDLLARSGLTTEQHAAVVESPAFGPLAAALRRAEAYHHDLERLVPRAVGQHGLDDADDIAAVLRYRVDKLAATPPSGCGLRPRLIAGLIPEPLGAMSAEARQAIDERTELMESRARALAEYAIGSHVAWTRRLGPGSARRSHGKAWRGAATTIAAYRDRYNITSDLPIGGDTKNDAQRADRHRALAILRAAGSLSTSEGYATSQSIEGQAISGP